MFEFSRIFDRQELTDIWQGVRSESLNKVEFQDWGRIPYQEAWDRQTKLHKSVIARKLENRKKENPPGVHHSVDPCSIDFPIVRDFQVRGCVWSARVRDLRWAVLIARAHSRAALEVV